MKLNVLKFISVIFIVVLIPSCSVLHTGPTNNDEDDLYNYIKIGNQVWLVENLKTTKYRNGDPIPNVTDENKWSQITKGAYCNYDNDSSKGSDFGRLYNWYAVNDPRGLAPHGWHIATDEEWDILVNYLGGKNVAGGKLKEKNTSNWFTPNSGATNEIRFTALPGGFRDYRGKFGAIGGEGEWWSSTDYGLNNAWFWSMSSISIKASRFYYGKNYGLSVRCIKD